MVVRTADQTLEEWLVAEICVVLLEVLLGRSHEFDGNELEAATYQKIVPSFSVSSCSPSLLEAADDLANKATLELVSMVVL